MKKEESNKMNPKVGIIMGSESDLKVMKNAAFIMQELSIPYEIKVVSAHRTPERMFEYAKSAHNRGIAIIIAGAGGAAHLPGMVASMTQLPVIGVPIRLKELEGLDSLMSIVQMPGGVPVATVGINNAKNAGLLAARILGINNHELYEKLNERRELIKETMIYDLNEKIEGCINSDEITTNEIGRNNKI
ncbi:N5-carboxyaminoimidazole ribonucleotide mutase [Anaerotignum neopropionicum]|uniref:N5-carboxyaminoimidazole ribonucleotide mutase n=2 Tax=Anaerotignum neopropionicum TaxID=36847 RepID=A0A136WCR5_9FIRM|nr:5-(carboxyamino)imidazole ribonucleotide mutase [Anaerotignum neopropionicum]KXL52109.1 N5-carboxyaminoimidazole ribonucleotide mutase [Anaerotignum neopropionicum]